MVKNALLAVQVRCDYFKRQIVFVRINNSEQITISKRYLFANLGVASRLRLEKHLSGENQTRIIIMKHAIVIVYDVDSMRKNQ